jgi:hypothetical protein
VVSVALYQATAEIDVVRVNGGPPRNMEHPIGHAAATII